MLTVNDLFNRLGRDRITTELGHGPQVLSRAAIDNVMPSSWYLGMRRLCETVGAECPDALFRWAEAKRSKPAAEPTGDAA